MKRAASWPILFLFFLFLGCQAVTGKTAGQNIDDAVLTSYVKTALVADKAANLVRVDVDTNNGVVYLGGTVSSGKDRERAAELARGVKGVRGVVNNLQVQP